MAGLALVMAACNPQITIETVESQNATAGAVNVNYANIVPSLQFTTSDNGCDFTGATYNGIPVPVTTTGDSHVATLDPNAVKIGCANDILRVRCASSARSDHDEAILHVSGASGLCPVCGNGLVEKGEICDDGNTANCDGCNSSCTVIEPLTCGDGIVCPPEQCDPGNGYCNPDCTTPRCGDGIINISAGAAFGLEACDDGDATHCGTCNGTCDGPGIGPAVCGDGVVCGETWGETCDEVDAGGPSTCIGNCNATCDGPANTCGDGIVRCGEECDDGGVCSNDPTHICTHQLLHNCAPGAHCIAISDDGCSSACVVEDHDGDGVNGPQVGGPDCNDFDPDTFPGAFDICNDGMDQNCMGGDAMGAGDTYNMIVDIAFQKFPLATTSLGFNVNSPVATRVPYKLWNLLSSSWVNAFCVPNLTGDNQNFESIACSAKLGEYRAADTGIGSVTFQTCDPLVTLRSVSAFQNPSADGAGKIMTNELLDPYLIDATIDMQDYSNPGLDIINTGLLVVWRFQAILNATDPRPGCTGSATFPCDSDAMDSMSPRLLNIIDNLRIFTDFVKSESYAGQTADIKSGPCKAGGSTCGLGDVNITSALRYTNTPTDGGALYYRTSTNEVYLHSEHAWRDDNIQHEFGHWAHIRVSPRDSGNGHDGDPNGVYTEAFATAHGLSVLNQQYYADRLVTDTMSLPPATTPATTPATPWYCEYIPDSTRVAICDCNSLVLSRVLTLNMADCFSLHRMEGVLMDIVDRIDGNESVSCPAAIQQNIGMREMILAARNITSDNALSAPGIDSADLLDELYKNQVNPTAACQCIQGIAQSHGFPYTCP